MTSSRHVVLLGLMASGKTTVGRLLAVRLGRPFVDNDVWLQTRTGHSARETAAAEGADALHRAEAEALVVALGSPVPAVVAAAGAAPFEALAAGPLAAHDRVYLRVAPDVLAARLERAPDDGHRPFVANDAPAVLRAQFAARDDGYRALATLIVDAAADPESVVDEITLALAR